MTDTNEETGSSERGATALSGFEQARVRGSAAIEPSGARSLLARVSLLLCTMTCAAGCLDTPPEYSEPTRIPPVIIMGLVDPPPTSLYVSSAPTIHFTVPFRADDFGERLRALFVRDIEIGTPQLVAEPDVESVPQSFEDQLDRNVNTPWTWNDGSASLAGCHTMTAIISDQDNVHNIYETQDPFNEARVTWFLWLRDPAAEGTDSVTVDCLQHKAAGATP